MADRFSQLVTRCHTVSLCQFKSSAQMNTFTWWTMGRLAEFVYTTSQRARRNWFKQPSGKDV